MATRKRRMTSEQEYEPRDDRVRGIRVVDEAGRVWTWTPMAHVAAPITASYGKQPDNSERKAGPPNLIVGILEDEEPA